MRKAVETRDLVKRYEDVEAIKARTSDLMQAQMKLGEAMYKAQQAAGPAAEGG